MADLREKDDASKIYVVLFMLHFKREHCLESAILVDFEQKNGPKSRSSVGGFPYNFREIIIEIIKKNWRWPWKSMFSIKINMFQGLKSKVQVKAYCVFTHPFIAFDRHFRSFRGTILNENRYIGAFNLADH